MNRRYWLAFAACALASVVPLFITHRLPMADLPEHVAQVSIWKHFGNDCYAFSEVFELNPATPYLLGYAVTRAIAFVVPVHAAIKVVVLLTVVFFPLSLLALLRQTKGDPWWSLAGFPLAYGFTFYWGFFNFSFAVPVGICYIALLLRRRAGLLPLFLCALLLLTGHALMLVFCAGLTAVIAAIDREPRKVLPIAAAMAVLAGWAIYMRSTEAAVQSETVWHLGMYRVRQLPSMLLSNETDLAATLLIGILLGAIALSRPALTRDLRRWVLFAAALAIYLFAPLSTFGTAFLFARFVPFVFAGLLLLVDNPRRQEIGRLLIVVSVIVWAIVLTARFGRFDADAAGFDLVTEQIPTNRRVLAFNVDPFSRDAPGPVFLHFAAYYQVQKGGIVARSFASSFPSLVRYRAGAEPVVRTGSVPRSYVDWQGVAQYDYVIIRGDPGTVVTRAPFPLVPKVRSGRWSLFATPRAQQPVRACPPLEP